VDVDCWLGPRVSSGRTFNPVAVRAAVAADCSGCGWFGAQVGTRRPCGGVSLSFIAIGLFVATIGFALGYDAGWFRDIAAVGMILIGAVLLVPPLQLRVAVVGGPISDWVDQSFGGFSRSGLGGQFGVGLLLGRHGAPAWGQHLVQHPFLRHKVRILALWL